MIVKICCLLNERSGTANSIRPQDVAHLFSQHGFRVKIVKIETGGSIAKLTDKAVKDGFDIVVAGGGDGTVNAVASALFRHRTVRLGILPLGTLNHLARDLG